MLEDAFKIMIEARPGLKLEMAVELYRSGKVSLSRGAEIAGVSAESFKSALEQRGYRRIVEAQSSNEVRKEVESILDRSRDS